VQGVTVYEFPTKDAARNWHDSMTYREVRGQHRKKGREISGNLGRRRSAVRRAADAADQSHRLDNAPVSFSIIAARADTTFPIKEELPRRGGAQCRRGCLTLVLAGVLL
jgi:hypothetical protein